MQEGKTGNAVEKRHDRGTLIEALLVYPPRLQCAARDVKHLCRLTLGEALGSEVAILGQEVRAFEALPMEVATMIASERLLDDRAHSCLLCPSLASVFVMAKDGEVAFSLQP